MLNERIKVGAFNIHHSSSFMDRLEKLKARLADLRAANSVGDLIAGEPQQVGEQIVLDLGDDNRMVFRANHTANPTTESGEVDWASVTRIKIVEIGRA